VIVILDGMIKAVTIQSVLSVTINVSLVLLQQQTVQLVKERIEIVISQIVLVLQDFLMMVSMLIVLLVTINAQPVLHQRQTVLLVRILIELLQILLNVTAIRQGTMSRVATIKSVGPVTINV